MLIPFSKTFELISLRLNKSQINLVLCSTCTNFLYLCCWTLSDRTDADRDIGGINNDGEVNIADINTIINMTLTQD